MFPLEDFPPLSCGRTKELCHNFEIGSPSAPSPALLKNPSNAWAGPRNALPSEKENTQPPPKPKESLKKAETAAEPPNIPYKPPPPQKSAAEILRGNRAEKGPQPFDPSTVKKIGSISVNNNRPAIYFSAEETHMLAESLGHAIVGKFSHSIPSTLQIQRALDGIKFTYGYTWKPINAKHILIQLDDITDYAKLLNGPKGKPVWLVGHNPMRVFKWTTDFDVFHESPIAAIWCNLIALPLHLYDTSALFAIGNLLGNPIQIDQSTADRSRLSFARLCIEIDITKSPDEVVVIEMGGSTLEIKVVWDKLPSYCTDCRHVGHKRYNCYAFGKKGHQPRNEHGNVNHKGKENGVSYGKDLVVQQIQTKSRYEWARKDHPLNHHAGPMIPNNARHGDDVSLDQTKIPDVYGDQPVPKEHDSGFQFQGRRRDRDRREEPSHQLRLSRSPGRGNRGNSGGGRYQMPRPHSLSPSSQVYAREQREHEHPAGEGPPATNILSLNKYYKLMENGTFDTEAYEEEDDQDGNMIIDEGYPLEDPPKVQNDGNTKDRGMGDDRPSGVANTPTRNAIKRLIVSHKVAFLAIIEPLTAPDPDFFSRALGLTFCGSNVNGKIWVFAHHDSTFEVEDDSEQVLHGRLSVSWLPQPLFISVVYGKCTREGRYPLWNKLWELAEPMEGVPWLVGGDFNTILQALDREGHYKQATGND